MKWVMLKCKNALCLTCCEGSVVFGGMARRCGRFSAVSVLLLFS